ncbi:MAG: OmpA family protein [Steroidobacteraceae bacterium]
MSTIRHSILLAAVLALPAAAQQVQLSPQAARITDEAIHADLAGYESVQGRIKALNDAGRPLRDYHLAKAQCWLDVSFHEYTRNDRSAFPQAALTESEKLVVGMEQGVSPLPTETPLVNGAARLREDLWRRFGALHGAPGFACAQQAVACGEVELVHAGNEFNQQQWRHSKPYIQIAEEMVGDAEAMARQCAAASVIAPAAPAAAAAPPATGVLTANVLFEFDRSGRADIRRYTLQTLDRELARVREEGLTLTGVELVGHADRLQGRGFDYNQALSEKRARTVRDLLAERGIEAGTIRYTYRGDTEQVQQCEGVSPRAALRECLIPNRRVEVLLHFSR